MNRATAEMFFVIICSFVLCFCVYQGIHKVTPDNKINTTGSSAIKVENRAIYLQGEQKK